MVGLPFHSARRPAIDEGGLHNPAVHSEGAGGLLALGHEETPLAERGPARERRAMSLDDTRFVQRSELLAMRPRPPLKLRLEGLWVAGDLTGLRSTTVAVVGCRAASDGGLARAHTLARDLASAGICVLSGLALGIDGSAHAGALAGGGRTIGILGGGHACSSPRRNRGLAELMLAAGGAVASPFPPAEPARRLSFCSANGMVAGLADAVVVVEAAARSGALNTA